MEIQNSYGGAISRSHHCGHGQDAGNAGDAATAVQRKFTLSMAAALRKRLGSAAVAAPADAAAASNPLQALVSMLQSAASTSASSGDPVPDLLSAVRDALSSARDALTGAGVSADEANKTVAAVSQQLGQALAPAAASSSIAATAADGVTPTPAGVGDLVTGPATAHSYAATYVRKEKASLDIFTQEGDRVQILFRSRQAVAMQSDSAGTDTANTSADTAGAAAAGSKVYAFASGRVQVAVQGDLSADELKAIGDLVGKVDELANQFFQGDMQQAFSSAVAIGFDPAQIAGFALKLSLKESYRQSGALPAATPAAALPTTQTAHAISTPPATTSSGGSNAAASAAASTAAPAAQTLQDTLAAFVRKVLDGVAQPSGAGRIEFSLRWKLNLVIAAVDAATPKATTPDATTGAKAVETPISTAPSDPAAARLLTQSLQSAAALAGTGVTAL